MRGLWIHPAWRWDNAEVTRKNLMDKPAIQDYFKQAAPRLYCIAAPVVNMTLDMCKDPERVIEDLSEMGSRSMGCDSQLAIAACNLPLAARSLQLAACNSTAGSTAGAGRAASHLAVGQLPTGSGTAPDPQGRGTAPCRIVAQLPAGAGQQTAG